ncbi:MAG: N-acetyltransferase [Rhodospirillales bacterium]|nr:MAG: N-acetyltransferase [Rhodospirillales bacterium]
MDGGEKRIEIEIVDGVGRVSAEAWDSCALAPDSEGNPFLSHAFLKALEDSRCLGRRTGWTPQYLVATDEAGATLGVAPMFVKSHSQGEYVFDHGWAQAFERAGGRYYPKLQVCAPFTPVPGPRLLVRPGPFAEATFDALASSMVGIADGNGISSLHVTYCPEKEWTRLSERHGFLRRMGRQYHWRNDGYADFDAFLAALNSRKRKAIRKERAAVARAGLRLHALTGAEIKPHHWDAFFAFYMDTADRKWGSPYLNREFFACLGETLADKVVLICAESEGRLVAGALNLRGDKALFGRNWGSVESFAFLHFEACYYQAIDYAIAHGLERVEAGAQGEHKIQRGYLPTPTYSAHWIRDPRFRDAVARFLDEERPEVEKSIEALAAYSPFRREDGDA